MKEKFRLVIETMHAPDRGIQENVSTMGTYINICSFFSMFCPHGDGENLLNLF